MEEVGWPAVYGFCLDRLRAVRQDLTVQQAAGPEALAVLRRCAVFHLYADYRSVSLLIGFDGYTYKKHLPCNLQEVYLQPVLCALKVE